MRHQKVRELDDAGSWAFRRQRRKAAMRKKRYADSGPAQPQRQKRRVWTISRTGNYVGDFTVKGVPR